MYRRIVTAHIVQNSGVKPADLSAALGGAGQITCMWLFTFLAPGTAGVEDADLQRGSRLAYFMLT